MKTMSRIRIFILILVIPITFLSLVNSCTGNSKKNEKAATTENNGLPQIVREQVKYTSGNDTLVGYLFYDKNSDERKPGIIVVPEWWGNNDYPQMRARKLAELGYTTFSADMYGGGKVVDNPKEAQENASRVYTDPAKLKNRMMAAYNTLSNSDKVNSERIAAIGYCFGGSVCLNAASMGVPLDAVVSFHGGLDGFKASPEIKNTKILVCNGRADQMVTREQLQQFKKEMNRVDAKFELREYDGATHAFTNPAATANGKKFNMPIAYNETADKASWQDMLDFFDANFPIK
ncbi:MAG: dienelactone hydrolase family protein [Chloroflexota bacterium]|jgi:dienelactone hydrolase